MPASSSLKENFFVKQRPTAAYWGQSAGQPQERPTGLQTGPFSPRRRPARGPRAARAHPKRGAHSPDTARIRVRTKYKPNAFRLVLFDTESSRRSPPRQKRSPLRRARGRPRDSAERAEARSGPTGASGPERDAARQPRRHPGAQPVRASAPTRRHRRPAAPASHPSRAPGARPQLLTGG